MPKFLNIHQKTSIELYLFVVVVVLLGKGQESGERKGREGMSE